MRIGDMKQNTHRERARERHKEYLYYQECNSYNNEQPTTTFTKVTKSLYIVTNLGQLPFMLITEMARTWAIKEDIVNTSIIHLYSTLPRKGRIRSLPKNTSINRRFSDRLVLSESAGSESKDRTGRVGRAEADRR